ncbi:MAG: flavodoxin [Synergistales bacterium]|nr:flavodoxin [Synergistales bacterium]MDY6402196.1 flavodoxin [Synergistales bacterium]MDY6404144.1 flavodoxin [Synergistales bacterium]MDY6409764.1 flavodoxin [Synergistales bacterium]MDY6414181.1 flavodoxin [Synergistales bacterium]
MNKFFLSLLVVLSLMSCACAAEAKTLVLVFSRADENYSVGFIKKGNTMILAEMIANKTGAELFEVKPAKKYPEKYDECIDLAKREQNQKARPEILEDKDVSEYDTIFFGYPIWWGDIPMCMYTFVEGHDWNGKKIIPFCTHEGSGAGRTESTLKRLMKGASVTKPLSMYGSTAQNRRIDAEKEISIWLNALGF